MADVEIVDIDATGVFKYILIKIKQGGEEKTLVRGYRWAEYHNDIFEKIQSELAAKGITSCECVGGGRILHESEKKKLKVYGYSQGFGRGDHALAVELIRQKFPDYDLSWSNEGY